MRDYVLTQALSYDRSGPFPVLRRLYSNWRKRRRLTDLQQLDDRILKDIGITSDFLPVENRNPLRQAFGRLDFTMPRWNSRVVLWTNYSRSDGSNFARPTKTWQT